MQSLRQRQFTSQTTQRYNAAVARLRQIRKIIDRRGRMYRSSYPAIRRTSLHFQGGKVPSRREKIGTPDRRLRSSGRIKQWWLNLFNGILPERKWKKNLKMNRAVFSVADELRLKHV